MIILLKKNAIKKKPVIFLNFEINEIEFDIYSDFSILISIIAANSSLHCYRSYPIYSSVSKCV